MLVLLTVISSGLRELNEQHTVSLLFLSLYCFYKEIKESFEQLKILASDVAHRKIVLIFSFKNTPGAACEIIILSR